MAAKTEQRECEMIKTFSQLPKRLTNQARSALLIIVAYLIATLIAAIPLILQLIKAPSWQLWVAVISVLTVTTASGIALWLVWRGGLEAGIWLTTSTALLTGLILTATFSGLGMIFFLSSATLNTLIALQTLQRRQATSLIIVGIAAGVLILLVDLFIPTQRPSIPGLQTLIYVMSAGMLLLFAYFISRQFRHYALRTKLMVSFVGVTLISISIIGFIANSISGARINEQTGSNLSVVSAALARGIADVVDNNINLVHTLSLNKPLQDKLSAANAAGTPSQAILDGLDQQWKNAPDTDPLITGVLENEVAEDLIEFQSKFPGFTETFVTDKNGAIVASSGRTSDYYQADEEWWQTAWNKGKGSVYVSQVVFDESANVNAIQIAVPVSSHGTTTPVGVLRTTVNLDKFAALITSIKIGQTGHADLIFSNNQTLTAETGFDVLSPEDAVSLSTLPATYGRITYEGDPRLVSKASVAAPLSQNRDAIEHLSWAVVVHQNIVETQTSVTAATRSISLAAIILAIAISILAQFLAQFLVDPITRLTAVANQVTAGNLKAQADIEDVDEIGALATAFNKMTSQLRDLISSLEQRVAERTRNLELAAEVGRSVSQVRALDVMLKDAAELIRAQFDLYYIQVYLTNPSQTALLLQAGTGTVGAELLGRAHQLPLNTASINGRAAIEKRSVVVADTTASVTFKPNPLLPDTRSEMAVPLMVGEKVVGVLDLQSQNPGTLNQDILPAFEALAGQLAIAIQNATLLAETEQARAEVEAQARCLVRKSWEEHLDAIHRPEQTGFVFEGNKVVPLTESVEILTPSDENVLTAPIAIANEPLGSLVVEMEVQNQSAHNVELVNIVARQVAQQIESLRLLENAERYRSEAEQAARRTTIEGWQQYMASRTEGSLGYMYDTKEVRPHNEILGSDDSAMTLPIKTREESIGKLTVEGIEPEDQDAIDLANAVAERLGAHLENLRLFEATKRGQIELDRRAQQLAAVAEISTASSKELDIDRMLASVVHLTQRKFGLYHAHVFTYNEIATELKIAACGWKEGDEHQGTHGTESISLDQEQSLVARAARTRQAIIVNDVHNEPGWLPNPLLPDTASEMAVPLVIGDELLGVLDVQSDRLNAFSDEDANIQTTLASQVATALQNARSFAKAQKQAERESMLNTIGQKIQSATTVEAVLQIAARELGHALGAPLTIAQLGVKPNGNGH